MFERLAFGVTEVFNTARLKSDYSVKQIGWPSITGERVSDGMRLCQTSVGF